MPHQKNRIQIGELLLKHKAAVNIRDKNMQTAIHRSAVHGYTVFTRLLLRHGANPNTADKIGNTPLHLACDEGHGDTALLLIEYDGDVERKNQEEKTPLDLCNKKLRNYIVQQTSR